MNKLLWDELWWLTVKPVGVMTDEQRRRQGILDDLLSDEDPTKSHNVWEAAYPYLRLEKEGP